MKVQLQYISALAITHAEPADVRSGAIEKAGSMEFAMSNLPKGTHGAIIEVRLKGEWQRVFETEPTYNNEDEAKAAMDRFIEKIKADTPYVGREWPLGKPVPHGFAIGPGGSGKRLLVRDKKFNRKHRKGPRNTKGRR